MQSNSTPANPLASSFLGPLQKAEHLASHLSRRCGAIADSDFLLSGIHRVLDATDSGRDHLQKMAASLPVTVKRSSYFESLKSKRRLAHTQEISRNITNVMGEVIPDLLAKALPLLDEYEVFAGDGHWHSHATHDKATSSTGGKYAMGHLYGLNLRTQGLFHLTAADQKARNKEHDMRGLKRQTIKDLRQGTATGRKVIWLWDPAGIDLRQWYRWKQAGGIYFISPVKKNMLIEEGNAPMPYDQTDPLNDGVLGDYLWAGNSCGVPMRLVHYRDPITGKEFHFVTSLTNSDIAPGVIAHLYRMRWDIEKVFDDVKNKLHETKAWASSETAKSNQANLICISHNLIRLFEKQMEIDHGLVNEGEKRRKSKRMAREKSKQEKKGEHLPVLFELLQRTTQASVKFIRWIRYSVFGQTCESTAIASLRCCYANL
tara:strand:- start:648 stop:1937 length:1290 start_codon:yes stop_codon:yes gene_type:complete